MYFLFSALGGMLAVEGVGIDNLLCLSIPELETDCFFEAYR